MNKAVKLSSDFLSLDKEYISLIKLGITTDSFDMDGKIVRTSKIPKLGESDISEIIKGFQGDYRQTIPIFSAKKLKGRHLYEYARKNIDTEKIKNDVRINKISIIKFQSPDLYLRLSVSSGTYIRAIANDIGERIGCGASMAKLNRLRIGEFLVKDALKTNEALNILDCYYSRKISGKEIKSTKSLIPVKNLVMNYKKIYVKERYLKNFELNGPLYEEMIEPGLNRELEFKPGEIIIINSEKFSKSYIHRAISEFKLKEISMENRKLSKSLSIN